MNDDQETVVGSPGIECPECKTLNPPDQVRCQKCHASLQRGSDDSTTVGRRMSWSLAPATIEGAAKAMAGLCPGSVLAGRYEILKLLGEGGMGAVFKALDKELDRVVAVKVIRPELAGRPEILQRFKQELILARQITHRNVIRIFDLGQADGIKFITMEYVEGRDLKNLLRERGKLASEEAVGIIHQVCLALDAAHSEGVVHRDLKPQNVMIDEHGRVVVMDFGIARSLEMSGMTVTGTLVGTPEYMSPEQAKGEKVDRRSDLFAMGLILYEMLAGRSPYEAESAMATLLKRVQEPARPPIEVDPSVPQVLSDIVTKCLARDPAERYQAAKQVLAGLDVWAGKAPPAEPATPTATTLVAGTLSPVAAPEQQRKAGPPWKWIGAGAAVAVLAAAGFLLRDRFAARPAGPQKPVTVLVADFKNATGDPVFDGTLEPTFILALEGASFISASNRSEARKTATQLQAGATKLDEPLARLVAMREGIHYVVSGSIYVEGGRYGLLARAIDAASGKTVTTHEIGGTNKNGVLTAVGKLAARIRNALGDDTPESLQVAAAETFSAASLEAAHAYALAQQVLVEGKMEEALRSYNDAIELDPNMARAYSGVGTMYRNLGRRQDAEKYFKEALARIDRMTDREKYRTRGIYYLTIGNQEKAIQEYSALASRYPADTAAHNNLAIAYSSLRNIPKALEEARLAAGLHPRSAVQRYNLGVIALYAGDLETAQREARTALEFNPSYGKAFITLALVELAQGRPAQAVDVYQRLDKLGALGASYSKSGLADLALYAGRFSEGAALLESGATADLEAKNPAYAASKVMHQAAALLLCGRKAAALTAAERALTWSQDPNVLFTVARVYVQAGQESKARPLITQLANRLEREPQSYAKLIEGEALLKRGNAREAIKVLLEGQKLLDTWISRFLLGRAYLEVGAFAEADSEFDLCLKRRGEAFILFRDEIPTSWMVPPVQYYLGRAREGLSSPGAAESYRTFLSIREKAGEDPLVADARRRLAKQ